MPFFLEWKSAPKRGKGESWMINVKAKFQTDVLNNNGLRKDGKNVNICFGNQAADMDTINTSLAVAFFLSNYHTADEIKAGPDKKNTSIDGYGDMVVPITSINRGEFKLRPDSVLCFKTAGWEFDELGAPKHLIFKDDLKNSNTKKLVVLQRPLVTLTDHNTHVPQLWTKQLFEEEVVRIVDHHVGDVEIIKSQFNANYNRHLMEWVKQFSASNPNTYQNYHCDISCGSAATMVSEPLANIQNTARVDYQGKATWMQNADGKPLQPVSGNELLPQDICWLLMSTIIIDTSNFKAGAGKAFNERDQSVIGPVYDNPQFLPPRFDGQDLHMDATCFCFASPVLPKVQSPTFPRIPWNPAVTKAWGKTIKHKRKAMGTIPAAKYLQVDAKQSFLTINNKATEVSYCIANIFKEFDAWNLLALQNLQRDLANGTMKESTAAIDKKVLNYKELLMTSGNHYFDGSLSALESFMDFKNMLLPGCVLMGKTSDHEDARLDYGIAGAKAFFVAVPIETGDKDAAAAKLRLENILAIFKDPNLAQKVSDNTKGRPFEIAARFALFKSNPGLQVSEEVEVSMPVTVGVKIVAAAFTMPGNLGSRKLLMPLLKWIMENNAKEHENHPAGQKAIFW